jgi:hypothetical protein
MAIDRADQTYAYLAARETLRAGGTLDAALAAAARAVRPSGVLDRWEAMAIGWAVADAVDNHRAEQRTHAGLAQAAE